MSLLISDEIRSLIRNTLMTEFEEAAKVTVRHIGLGGRRGMAVNTPETAYHVVFVYEFNGNRLSLCDIPETIQFADHVNNIHYAGFELRSFLKKIGTYNVAAWSNLFNCRLEGTLADRVVDRMGRQDIYHVFSTTSLSTEGYVSYLKTHRVAPGGKVLLDQQRDRVRSVVSNVMFMARAYALRGVDDAADLKMLLLEGRRSAGNRPAHTPEELTLIQGAFMALPDDCTEDMYNETAQENAERLGVVFDFVHEISNYFYTEENIRDQVRMAYNHRPEVTFRPGQDNSDFDILKKPTRFGMRLDSILID